MDPKPAKKKRAAAKAAPPTLEQWQQAYDLADRIRDLAPWTWMCDIDVIGFEDPDDGSPRFFSVMGKAGQHVAVAVYHGPEDVFRILDLGRDPGVVPDSLFETAQVQLSFEDRDCLEAEDREVIRSLGRKYRGRQAWPWFRSYLPGQYPWHVNGNELRLLTAGLEQVLAVTPRFRDDEDALERLNRVLMEEDVFLMRRPVTADGVTTWHDSMELVERPERVVVSKVKADMLARAARFPVENCRLEIEVRPLVRPVQERSGQRPFFFYVVLVVESGSGMAIGYDTLRPRPTLDAAYSQAAEVLLEALIQGGFRPKEACVRTEGVAALFRGLCDRLGITLTVTPSVPKAAEAFTAMAEFLDIEP
ncbi:MAG: hypothetical protein GX595_19665 [Lentisphaerae bacterium]|nr:hypothetical protein [Lentisphaerota bacterium]